MRRGRDPLPPSDFKPHLRHADQDLECARGALLCAAVAGAAVAADDKPKAGAAPIAPTVDAATRNGLVYVDLPQPGTAKASMFARGEFDSGSVSALMLPQSAVLLRDGFSYVF